MIKTDDVILPSQKSSRILGRNKNIRKYWNELVADDLAKNPQKQIKHISNQFISYLSNKLNCLYSKYSDSSEICNSLYFIFHGNSMSNLIKEYYNHINEESVNKDIQRLFELLEEEFHSLNHQPILTNELIKEFSLDN